MMKEWARLVGGAALWALGAFMIIVSVVEIAGLGGIRYLIWFSGGWIILKSAWEADILNPPAARRGTDPGGRGGQVRRDSEA